MRISVTHDLARLRRELGVIERRHLPRAAQAALNRAARSTNGAAIKASAGELGLKQKFVKRAVKFLQAKRGRLVAEIRARGRDLNLIWFAGPSETREKAFRRGGVRARQGRQWRVFPGSFIGNRGKTVFRRRSRVRSDLEPVTGGNVPQTLTSKPVQRAINRKFAERWPVELRQSLRRFLRRAR